MARRKTAWFGTAFDYTTISTGLTQIVLVSDAILHAVSQEPTIIRIVGRLVFQHIRDSGGFSESMRSNCFAGIMCMHDGIGALDPNARLDEEHWMWTGFMNSESTFTQYPDRLNASDTIIGGSTESRGTQHISSSTSHVDIDSRSMRKAPEPCRLTLNLKVSEVETETGATHKLSGILRFLVKV